MAELIKADRIIVDLEALTFIDSVGLGVLLKTSRRSARDGNRLEITRGQGQPAEIFRLTGLEKVLPLADPALCPSIQEPGEAPGARAMPDDANRPRTGEHILVGPTAWC